MSGPGCAITLRDDPFLPKWFRTAYDFQFVCQIVVHEYGHMLGLDHIPGTIMDAYQNYQPKVCKGEKL